MTTSLEELAEEINGLPPPARLRLAADLLEQRKPELAHSVASRVVTELGAVLALHDLKQRKDPRQ